MEDHSTPEGLYCPDCGYDLRGGLTDRCPECGLPLDPQTLHEPRIPWVHRAKLGPTRAYLRTLRLAMLHPAHLGAQSTKPLTLADARAFQRVTVWLATLPVIALSATWYATAIAPIDHWEGPLSLVGGLFEWLTLVSLAIGAGLFFHAMTAAPSLFFRPKSLPPERRTRAAAASYYACAPLAFLSLLLPAASIAWFALTRFPSLLWRTPLFAYATWFILLSPALMLIWFGLSTLAILKRSTHCGLPRQLTTALLLPPLWTLLAALLLIGIPTATTYVGLMVLSFL